MKRLALTLAIGITLSTMISCSAALDASSEMTQAATSDEDILNVTVSIQLLAPNPEKPGRQIMARGTGTLVSHSGQNLIITHDHWGEILETMTEARILDADNQLILKLGAQSFQELIQHRDGGTMLLSAPESMIPDHLNGRTNQAAVRFLTTADLAAGNEIQTGDTVQVTYHVPENDNQMGILRAMVETVENTDTQQILTLSTLDGQALVPGDSGGGVWLNGRLVGNVWSRLLVQDTSGQTLGATDLMMAATQPLEAS